MIFPVTALIGALYPTLCRLWVEDRQEYNATAQGALRAAFVLTVPVAVGCIMFAELGVLRHRFDHVFDEWLDGHERTCQCAGLCILAVMPTCIFRS